MDQKSETWRKVWKLEITNECNLEKKQKNTVWVTICNHFADCVFSRGQRSERETEEKKLKLQIIQFVTQKAHNHLSQRRLI